MPDIDAIDVWASLMVFNNTKSPRTTIPLAFDADNQALIDGDWKIVMGTQMGRGTWQGPIYPNVSSYAHRWEFALIKSKLLNFVCY